MLMLVNFNVLKWFSVSIRTFWQVQHSCYFIYTLPAFFTHLTTNPCILRYITTSESLSFRPDLCNWDLHLHSDISKPLIYIDTGVLLQATTEVWVLKKNQIQLYCTVRIFFQPLPNVKWGIPSKSLNNVIYVWTTWMLGHIMYGWPLCISKVTTIILNWCAPKLFGFRKIYKLDQFHNSEERNWNNAYYT